MFAFIRGLMQFVVLVGAVLSAVYAVSPDVRRWIETELVARHAHYYVGMLKIRPGGAEEWQRVQFYSNRWELDQKIFDERLREDDEDAFDVFRKVIGEVLIAAPDESYGPLPGRSAAEPMASIETLALADQCFLVHRVLCRYPFADERGVISYQTDPECTRTEAAIDAAPNATHSVAVWVKAVKFTCS